MRAEVMDELIAEAERLEKLIADGDLPDTPHVWHRLAYVGHEVVHTYGNQGENALYRCVGCRQDFRGHDGACPSCGKREDSFQINIHRGARWRCLSCRHEWDGEDGEICPECKKPWR
jgi:hypothetical protein